MVSFIGHEIKDRWFPDIDAVGKSIQIEGRPYEVIGVAKAKGSVFGQSQDNWLSIPVETYFKSYGARKGINYSVVAAGHYKLMQAQDEVRSFRDHHTVHDRGRCTHLPGRPPRVLESASEWVCSLGFGQQTRPRDWTR